MNSLPKHPLIGGHPTSTSENESTTSSEAEAEAKSTSNVIDISGQKYQLADGSVSGGDIQQWANL